MIPQLNPATSMLPLGRYGCTLAEVKAQYVHSSQFASSSTRAQIFSDLLAVKAMLDAMNLKLVERIWIGGSFVTGALDPDDIDCTFWINAEEFDALPSNSQRNKLLNFNKKGRLRTTTNLRVEPFLVVRVPIANPWSKGGVSADATFYTSLRGAWDDWWQRVRSDPNKATLPIVQDAEPRRGYLEVSW
ncbi:hypothetical protein N9A08_12795 [Arthrobacter koreensis]|uniref:LicD family protein n=1 Tax=Arthrobacter koreensis TaxID=199136 RepID=A0ABY6FQL1_9MICC|nr:hypothetical protein [Arthrobacter koreensis]UYB35495.1 hypothetical protein N9A08_12795 [Arthrobacter koreensis]